MTHSRSSSNVTDAPRSASGFIWRMKHRSDSHLRSVNCFSATAMPACTSQWSYRVAGRVRKITSHQILIFTSFKRSSLMTDSTPPRFETAGGDEKERNHEARNTARCHCMFLCRGAGRRRVRRRIRESRQSQRQSVRNCRLACLSVLPAKRRAPCDEGVLGVARARPVTSARSRPRTSMRSRSARGSSMPRPLISSTLHAGQRRRPRPARARQQRRIRPLSPQSCDGYRTLHVLGWDREVHVLQCQRRSVAAYGRSQLALGRDVQLRSARLNRDLALH